MSITHTKSLKELIIDSFSIRMKSVNYTGIFSFDYIDCKWLDEETSIDEIYSELYPISAPKEVCVLAHLPSTWATGEYIPTF